jgi:hypothetical protein
MVNLRRLAGIPNSRTPANITPLPPSHRGALLGVSPAAVVILSVMVPLGVPPLSVIGPPLTEHPIFAELGAVQVKLIVPL